MDLLDDWVKGKGLPDPEWAPDGKSVIVDEETYTLDQFGK